MTSFNKLSDYPNELRRNKSEHVELLNIISCVDKLVTPEKDSILDELNKQLSAITSELEKYKAEAIGEFLALLRLGAGQSQREINPYTNECVSVCRIYQDAVAIIEGFTRRVFWMDDSGLNFQDFSVNLELHLEAEKPMSDYIITPF